MRGCYLSHQNLGYRKDNPLPKLEKNQALVKVELAGICATDLALCGGYYPFEGILGHEFVGKIVEAPDAPERIGQRVVGEINLSCGRCVQCLQGRLKHCSERKVLGIKNHHGAFADYLSLDLNLLYQVDDKVSNQQAVFTEPLAAALAIQEQVHIKPTDKVLVIGAGRLGQLIARTLALTGCDLQVVARYPFQQQLLEKHHIANVLEADVTQAGFDKVIEASGSVSGFKLARLAIRPQGIVVLKTTIKETLSLDASWVVDEICVLGSRCGDFPPALRLLTQGLIHPEDLITDVFPLAGTEEAFKRATEKNSLKVLFDMSL